MGWLEKLSETEQRKRRARLLYDFEVECRDGAVAGGGARPTSVASNPLNDRAGASFGASRPFSCIVPGRKNGTFSVTSADAD